MTRHHRPTKVIPCWHGGNHPTAIS